MVSPTVPEAGVPVFTITNHLLVTLTPTLPEQLLAQSLGSITAVLVQFPLVIQYQLMYALNPDPAFRLIPVHVIVSPNTLNVPVSANHV